MRRQVLPTAPSPTTTHLMACISWRYDDMMWSLLWPYLILSVSLPDMWLVESMRHVRAIWLDGHYTAFYFNISNSWNWRFFGWTSKHTDWYSNWSGWNKRQATRSLLWWSIHSVALASASPQPIYLLWRWSIWLKVMRSKRAADCVLCSPWRLCKSISWSITSTPVTC